MRKEKTATKISGIFNIQHKQEKSYTRRGGVTVRALDVGGQGTHRKND